MDEIQIVGICTVIENALGSEWWKMPHTEHTRVVREYIEANDAHYYARPKEDFFEWEGAQEAAKLGKKIVVVEDMS